MAVRTLPSLLAPSTRAIGDLPPAIVDVRVRPTGAQRSVGRRERRPTRTKGRSAVGAQGSTTNQTSPTSWPVASPGTESFAQ